MGYLVGGQRRCLEVATIDGVRVLRACEGKIKGFREGMKGEGYGIKERSKRLVF